MPRFLFVTGKLAAEALAATLTRMAPDFSYEVAVMPIWVVALMDTRFIAKYLRDPRQCEAVMIPGLCQGDTAPIADSLGLPVQKGPKISKTCPRSSARSGS